MMSDDLTGHQEQMLYNDFRQIQEICRTAANFVFGNTTKTGDDSGDGWTFLCVDTQEWEAFSNAVAKREGMDELFQ